MENNKTLIYLLIWWATVALIGVISRLLGSFNNNNNQSDDIRVNNIKQQEKSLPQACKDYMKIMSCIMTSEKLSGSLDTINESYQQLLSEWNIINDATILEWKCSSYYDYMLSVQDTGYQEIIQSCK